MGTPEWSAADGVPELEAGAAHVWRVDGRTQEFRANLDVLSADERKRAGAFRFAPDRESYAAARATLRRLLGAYVGRAPHALHLVSGPAGKPALSPSGPDERAVQFNVSHSGDVALLAFAGMEVGVDVERCRENIAMVDLARRFFSPVESAAVAAATEERRPGVFYSCWTKKEACLKAVGTGLQLALDSFTVRTDDGAGIERVRLAMAQGTCEVVLHPVPSIAGYRAALAVRERAASAVRFLHYPPAGGAA